ncbi:transposase [Gluconacetobacter sp. 1c LMG 22058]|uniref:Transposase n=1 Tax=Gluconacetobacter dulcium TaxID=2729096 RepID=A0A7W4K2C6_9PROT|nr:transposase [Gluconacetobacter dulcium]MBB2199114.1 transposase [Gluconacetobacter dulcium]
MRHEILIVVERRRRSPAEQKLSILSEVGVDGACVSDAVRRHDLTRQHLYQCRRWLRKHNPVSDQGVRFLPVGTVDGRTSPSGCCEPSGSGRVEILLRKGRLIGVTGDPGDDMLARIIRIAETV